MSQQKLTHKFVETIPENLDEGILYISIPYTTATHLCCCGCGLEVVTPFSPTDWEFIFNGESVSLSPSIGNWGFSCRSHYWIKNNKVKWAGSMSSQQIKGVRLRDRMAKEKRYSKKQPKLKSTDDLITQSIPSETKKEPSMLEQLSKFIKSIWK